MSIWATRASIGWDEPEHTAAVDGVIGYADGWSNHYPEPGVVEMPAHIDLAEIPHWCVPGVDEGDVDDDTTGPWLRMSLSTWDLFYERPMTADGATVSLNPEAAIALGNALLAWANTEHQEPQ